MLSCSHLPFTNSLLLLTVKWKKSCEYPLGALFQWGNYSYEKNKMPTLIVCEDANPKSPDCIYTGKGIMKTVNYLRFCSLTLSLQYPRNSIKSDSQLLALLLLIVQILLVSFPLRIYTIKGGGKRKAEGTTPLNLERFFKWAIKTRFH